MLEKYLSEDQLDAIQKSRKSLGPDGQVKANESWDALKAEVRVAVAKGVAPTTAEGKALGARWKALVDQFTGGDHAIEGALRQMYHGDEALKRATGNDDQMIDWIDKAIGR